MLWCENSQAVHSIGSVHMPTTSTAVEEDIKSNPRSTSFYRAMQMSEGVLLVLDSAGTPFERIWCCFEEAMATALEIPRKCDESIIEMFTIVNECDMMSLG